MYDGYNYDMFTFVGIDKLLFGSSKQRDAKARWWKWGVNMGEFEMV